MRCDRGFYLLEHWSGKPSAEVSRNPSNNTQHFAHVEGVFDKIIMRCDRGFYLLEHWSGKPSAEASRNPSNGGKHADATVLQFCLSHQVDRNRVCCAKGVETLLSTNPA